MTNPADLAAQARSLAHDVAAFHRSSDLGALLNRISDLEAAATRAPAEGGRMSNFDYERAVGLVQSFNKDEAERNGDSDWKPPLPADWIVQAVLHAYHMSRNRALADAAETCERLDCAHRCGVGHEVAAKIRALTRQPAEARGDEKQYRPAPKGPPYAPEPKGPPYAPVPHERGKLKRKTP
jgi:hypothetical protein